MAVYTNKRSTMVLYITPHDLECHRVRIIMAEKAITPELIEIAPGEQSKELLDINPYGSVPSLVDRDLVLYDANVITEYLEERFPHPPLLPVYPIARAKNRLMVMRIQREWYSLVRRIQHGDAEQAAKAREQLQAKLTSMAPVFASMPYFLSEEFTLIDCCFAPLLWRLGRLGIQLPASAQAIHNYAERLFKRDSFKASITETEYEDYYL